METDEYLTTNEVKDWVTKILIEDSFFKRDDIGWRVGAKYRIDHLSVQIELMGRAE